ncbi:hypothetical protein Hanom_Chr09g00796371 [Helianthus anomalus]
MDGSPSKNHTRYREYKHNIPSQIPNLYTNFHPDAKYQKFKKNDGETANQLTKAIAVDVSNLVQWFCEQLLKSLPMRTVIPADAHAAANVRVDVICINNILS